MSVGEPVDVGLGATAAPLPAPEGLGDTDGLGDTGGTEVGKVSDGCTLGPGPAGPVSKLDWLAKATPDIMTRAAAAAANGRIQCRARRLARVMSGGQQQRLALAVALAGRPAVLLADEPTSQLDRHTGDAVIALMLAARERHGTALIIVTHDHHVSDALDIEYAIHNGSLVAGSWLASAAGQGQGPDEGGFGDGLAGTTTESPQDDPWAEPS